MKKTVILALLTIMPSLGDYLEDDGSITLSIGNRPHDLFTRQPGLLQSYWYRRSPLNASEVNGQGLKYRC